jgi:hypothetical protein
MAVPKKKTSKSKRDKRKATWEAQGGTASSKSPVSRQGRFEWTLFLCLSDRRGRRGRKLRLTNGESAQAWGGLFVDVNFALMAKFNATV